MNETWKECVQGYEVSDCGRVRRSTPGRRTFAGRLMKLQLLAIGYYAVRPTVCGRNKGFYVHDLVAAAFIGPKPKGASVNHIDGDKTNNSASNLEYVTHAGNMAHAAAAGLMVKGEKHPASKLTEDSVRQLRLDRDNGMSFSRLAKKHGISTSTAFQIVTRKYWSHIA